MRPGGRRRTSVSAAVQHLWQASGLRGEHPISYLWAPFLKPVRETFKGTRRGTRKGTRIAPFAPYKPLIVVHLSNPKRNPDRIINGPETLELQCMWIEDSRGLSKFEGLGAKTPKVRFSRSLEVGRDLRSTSTRLLYRKAPEP